MCWWSSEVFLSKQKMIYEIILKMKTIMLKALNSSRCTKKAPVEKSEFTIFLDLEFCEKFWYVDSYSHRLGSDLKDTA